MKLKLKLNFKLSKGLLKSAGLFAGSFVVVNVAVFFLLRAMQPHVGPRAMPATHEAAPCEMAHADSTAEAPADSAALAATLPDSARVDSVLLSAAVDSLPMAEALPAADSTARAEVAQVEPAPEEVAEPDAAEELPAANNPAEFAKLAKAMEAMKPEDAAAIASQLTTDQIVALVMLMKDRTAGRVLAALPVDQAALVAVRMSQTATR